MQKALAGLTGVKKVDRKDTNNTLVVTYNSAQVNPQRIVQTIKEVGLPGIIRRVSRKISHWQHKT